MINHKFIRFHAAQCRALKTRFFRYCYPTRIFGELRYVTEDMLDQKPLKYIIFQLVTGKKHFLGRFTKPTRQARDALRIKVT